MKGGPCRRISYFRRSLSRLTTAGRSAVATTITVEDTDLPVCNPERRMSFHFGNVHVTRGPQADVQDRAIGRHGEFYRRHEQGFATLHVRDGEVELGPVLSSSFGHDVPVAADRYTPVEK